MAGALTKYFGEAFGKQSLTQALKAGGWKVILDGNLAEQLVEHGPGGVLVGVDQFGNKYFEKKDAQWIRNRWVIYNDSGDWRHQEPSTIPPEWHGWLHGITDEHPANSDDLKRPIYAIDAKANPTMTKDHYLPKGAWENPQRRSWRKYEAWHPPSPKPEP